MTVTQANCYLDPDVSYIFLSDYDNITYELQGNEDAFIHPQLCGVLDYLESPRKGPKDQGITFVSSERSFFREIKLKQIRMLTMFYLKHFFFFFCLLLIHKGEGNGNPLQYSCLENPMDGGAW